MDSVAASRGLGCNTEVSGELSRSASLLLPAETGVRSFVSTPSGTFVAPPHIGVATPHGSRNTAHGDDTAGGTPMVQSAASTRRTRHASRH